MPFENPNPEALLVADPRPSRDPPDSPSPLPGCPICRTDELADELKRVSDRLADELKSLSHRLANLEMRVVEMEDDDSGMGWSCSDEEEEGPGASAPFRRPASASDSEDAERVRRREDLPEASVGERRRADLEGRHEALERRVGELEGGFVRTRAESRSEVCGGRTESPRVRNINVTSNTYVNTAPNDARDR